MDSPVSCKRTRITERLRRENQLNSSVGLENNYVPFHIVRTCVASRPYGREHGPLEQIFV